MTALADVRVTRACRAVHATASPNGTGLRRLRLAGRVQEEEEDEGDDVDGAEGREPWAPFSRKPMSS
ncbi:hypothetical protein KE639_04755 [Streptomyces sp. V17-9]|nr:hypothetical protein KE639_04755 [Streptomyces sp. V17-9]